MGEPDGPHAGQDTAGGGKNRVDETPEIEPSRADDLSNGPPPTKVAPLALIQPLILSARTRVNAAATDEPGQARQRSPDPAPDGTGEASAPSVSPATGTRARTRRRRLARAGARGIWLLVLAPLVFALLLPILMIGQEITAPTWIKQRVEAQAAAVLGGGSLTFGEITIEIGRDLHPLIRLRDAAFRDAAGSLLARVPQIEGRVSPRGLILRREILVQHIRLLGAEIALRRGTDGRVAISFDGAAAGLEAESFGALVQAFDAVFDRPALEALELVDVANLVLNFEDERVQRSWLVDGGEMSLELRDGKTRLRADLAVLSGRSYVTALSLDYESPRSGPEARLDIVVSDVAAADVATQSPALSWLGLLDGRVSARLSGGTLADGTLAPLAVRLEVGSGAVRPARVAAPVTFDSMVAELTFAPEEGRIDFTRLAVTSEVGRVELRGHAYLQDLDSGLPQILIGQFEMPQLILARGENAPMPLELSGGFADFRLRLAPFSVEIGQIGVRDGTAAEAPRLSGAGVVSAGNEGWRLALDVAVDRIAQDRLLDFWPETFRPRTRRWLAQNLTEAMLQDLTLGLRIAPGAAPVWALSGAFEEVTIRPMRQLPPITAAAGTLAMQQGGLVMTLATGRMAMLQGGGIDLGGSVFSIPDMAAATAPARLDLVTDSTLTAALTLLDQPPFGFIAKAGLPTALGDGRVQVRGAVDFPLAGPVPRPAPEFAFEAQIAGFRTDVLVPGRALSADRVRVSVDPDGMSLTGDVRLDGMTADVVWQREFGTAAPSGSHVDATVRLDQSFLAAAGIALPAGMVAGAGQATLTLDLRRDTATAFRLTSDLRGLALSVPALGWSKPAGIGGAFEIAGRLGEVADIDRIALTAPGIEASGEISLRPGGGLGRLRLDTLRVGGWLSAAVDLIGRGPGQAPEVRVNGGAVDLRRARFDQGAGPGSGQGRADGGPMRIALDRLDITDGIAITAFDGTFDGAGGFDGRFRGLLNGAARVDGVVAPIGNRFGVRVMSADAGGVLAASGLLQTAAGGTLDLTLTPGRAAGIYDGVVAITDLRVVEAPALARLLDAISVVGLLQQLGGQGLLFSNVDATFRLAPDRITVTQASAVGPGLGISADGFYLLAARQLDFQGVVSPVYLLNGIGSILTRPGEGLFGFNFTVTGPVRDASVSVNPLSVLTPGMFREIFRRPVPVLD